MTSARPCSCRGERFARRFDARVPERYRHMSIERPPIVWMDSPAAAAVRAYVADLDAALTNGGGLWLTGPAGSGKSSLAFLVASTALRSGKRTLALSGEGLLAGLRPSEADRSQELTVALRECALLVLDDLIPPKLSEWGREQISIVLDERWAGCRATIATTAISLPSAVIVELGERSHSRLMGICGQPLGCS
jgi:DNA replication protein DnaC